MILYRGIADTFPSKMDNKPREGMYGKAVYLSKRREVAYWYSFKKCEIFGIIIQYDCTARIMEFLEDTHFKGDHPTAEHFTLTREGRELLGVVRETINKLDLMDLVVARDFDGIHIGDLSTSTEEIVALADYYEIEPVEILFKSYACEEMMSGLSEKKMRAIVNKLKKELAQYELEGDILGDLEELIGSDVFS